MRKTLLAITLLIAWTSLSRAVSRVGGGKISSLSSGFEMIVPQNFTNLFATRTESVRAEGPPVYVYGRGVTTQFVDITEFQDEFADFTNYSALEIRERLEQSKWRLVSESDCAIIMKNNDPKIVAYIGTWGAGKGFVLKGLNLPDVDQAMIGMLGSLRVTPGSCAWKQ
ncbi:hypothetical protein [Bdellovibrio sp. GT3]|uniref:hypothetical protein n=1 Tax=Bdellovibrio sp. GT3 TaxID=3136282 RepID=UPI0030F22457